LSCGNYQSFFALLKVRKPSWGHFYNYGEFEMSKFITIEALKKYQPTLSEAESFCREQKATKSAWDKELPPPTEEFMRQKEGLVSYNIRFSSELYEQLKQWQVQESVRLNRVVSVNQCIIKAVKDKIKEKISNMDVA
jgi:hypothetical protein